MAELLIIEAMFVVKLRRRNYFALRLSACLAIIFTVVGLFPVRYTAWYNSMMFLLFFALTLGGIAFCFRDTFWNIIFCGLAAYTVKHIAYLLNAMLINAFTDNSGNVYTGDAFTEQSGWQLAVSILVYIECYAMVYAEAYLLFIKIIPKEPDLQLGRANIIVISGLVIIVDIVTNMFTVYNENADELSVFLEQLYNLITCLLVLWLQFQKLRQKQILEDYDIIRKILDREQQQYKHLKENMDIINVKCHDLKHQLRETRHSEHIDLNELKSVEQAISIYQAAARTGNETLDIILMDKLLYCDDKGINITCIADGKSISFMREEDIYSLFGNALDNAITAVEELVEPPREIKLSVKSLGDVVKIRIENKFTGKLKLEDGVPVTTKRDKQYHGFGMLSMRMVAAKYGGKLNVEIKDDMFALNVVFGDVAKYGK